jgi:hypothetical protein
VFGSGKRQREEAERRGREEMLYLLLPHTGLVRSIGV